MTAKESKKIIKSYNHLAQTLLEFQALWQAAWERGADAAVALMQNPVLVLHPTTGQLHVNLDSAVLRVLQEAKWFIRLGVSIPDHVRRALLTSESLSMHHATLAHAIAEIGLVQAAVPGPLRAMLQPHINAVIKRAEVRVTYILCRCQGYYNSFNPFTASRCVHNCFTSKWFCYAAWLELCLLDFGHP